MAEIQDLWRETLHDVGPLARNTCCGRRSTPRSDVSCFSSFLISEYLTIQNTRPMCSDPFELETCINSCCVCISTGTFGLLQEPLEALSHRPGGREIYILSRSNSVVK